MAASVTLEAGRQGDEALIQALRQHVAHEIGPIAKPDDICFTDVLPKTRSGKIMRRILRALASGQTIQGDTQRPGGRYGVGAVAGQRLGALLRLQAHAVVGLGFGLA